MLEVFLDTVPAHTPADAFSVLEQESEIDLILTTIAFDDSRMIEFLQAVKRSAPTSAIPFLCSRILPSVLSDHLVESMRGVCRQCGACDLVDVAKLRPAAAQAALRAAVTSCLQTRQ